jgi:hypothetical protein
MTEPLYAFNERQKDKILQLLDQTPEIARKPTGDESLIMIGVVGAGGITARAGTTPGTGTVNVYHINSSGVLSQYNGHTETVYNLSSSAIAAGAYVQCKREYISWKWFVDFEDC